MLFVIGLLNVLQEALANLACQLWLIVMLQPFYCYPLQRCPAIGCIPLLAIIDRGCHQTTGFKQLFFHSRSGTLSLFIPGQLHIEREKRSSRQLVMNLFFTEIVIGIPALFLIPQVTINRCLTFFSRRGKRFRFVILFCQSG